MNESCPIVEMSSLAGSRHRCVRESNDSYDTNEKVMSRTSMSHVPQMKSIPMQAYETHACVCQISHMRQINESFITLECVMYRT